MPGEDCLRYAKRSLLFKSFISRCRARSLFLSLGHMTTHKGMSSAGLCRVYTPFLKPSIFFIPAMLRVWEVTLLLGSNWLRLMGACSVGVRSRHVRLSFSLAHEFFPQTAPIIGSKLGRSFTVDVNEPKPNMPNTMNLVKK